MSAPVLGIDPGLSGGLALLVDGQAPILRLMPAIAVSTRKSTHHAQVLDAGGLYRIVWELAQLNPVVFLEKVHSMPKQGVASAFKFGRTVGVVEGILAARGLPLRLVTPQRWQKHLHADCEGADPKQRSLLAATRLFPGLDLRASETSRTPHPGLVDALLIAEFGRRQLAGEIP